MPSVSDDPVRYPRRILCPTDFSPFSERALQYAIALARPVGAEIALLHVCLLPIPSVEDDSLPAWMPDEPCPTTLLVDRFRRFAEPIGAAGLPTMLLLREGDPADEILRAAGSFDADLIVMGSHGRRGFEGWILGSHAERVLRTASCPVLTVSGLTGEGPEDASVRIEEILCAASASEHSPATVAYAGCLAAGVGAHLTLVHVSDAIHPSHAALPSGPDQARLGAVGLEERITGGAPSAEILRSAQERATDLIVMGNHDRGPFAFGFLGSTTDRVVREAECGVLTVRAASPSTRSDRSSEAATVAADAGGQEVEHVAQH